MHPVTGERITYPVRLGGLVLVVRKDEIQAAAVDVECGATLGLRHGRACDVPARPAGSPWRFPGWLTGFGRLPHGEVSRVLLTGRFRLALHHLVQPLTGQEPVVRLGTDREVEVTGRRVGLASLDQLADHGDDLRDVAGRPRLDRWPQAAKRVVGIAECALV